MSAWKQAMQDAAQLTTPTETEVGRVRGGLGLEPTTELLRDVPGPTRAMTARVRGRLEERERRWQFGLGAGLALAAAALITVGVVGGLREAEAEPTGPTTVALGSGSVKLEAVAVVAEGVGKAVGQGTDWSLEWSRGRVAVEVPPDGLHTVEVVTPEAVVRVVGTLFDVDRDALGTAVGVTRGTVEVDCTLGEDAVLHAGDRIWCLPATATGLLGRALALADGGEAPEMVLSALDSGLALQAEDAVRSELIAARIGPLVALDRKAEALDAAEQYLALGVEARDASVRRAAVALSLAIGGCQRALPHLEALAEPSGAEQAQLLACRDEGEQPR